MDILTKMTPLSPVLSISLVLFFTQALTDELAVRCFAAPCRGIWLAISLSKSDTHTTCIHVVDWDDVYGSVVGEEVAGDAVDIAATATKTNNKKNNKRKVYIYIYIRTFMH